MTEDEEKWLMIIGLGIVIIVLFACIGAWIAEATAP